jgi:hypothetical protein
MRAVLAAALSLALVLAAGTPHLHASPHGPEECAACVVRSGGDVARCQVPELAPSSRPVGRVPPGPPVSPVSGAPLGAVPGQSPPAA